jgi:hypothetical protein
MWRRLTLRASWMGTLLIIDEAPRGGPWAPVVIGGLLFVDNLFRLKVFAGQKSKAPAK